MYAQVIMFDLCHLMTAYAKLRCNSKKKYLFPGETDKLTTETGRTGYGYRRAHSREDIFR